MFILVMMMAFFSMAIEWSLIRKFPWLLRLMENPKIGPIISLLFSFALSIMLGMVFGAAGLIVMLGGVMSTVMMQPIYKMIRTGRWTELENKIENGKAAYEQHKASIFSFVKDVMIIIKLMVAIIAIPIWIMVKTISLIARICEFIIDPKSAVKKLTK